jgi:hypothetical protein
MAATAAASDKDAEIKELKLTVDIESGSPSINEAPVAIGMVLANGLTNKVIEEKLFTRYVPLNCKKLPPGFSKKCWTEFWLNSKGRKDFENNYANLLGWNEKAGTIRDMGKELVDYVNGIEVRFPNAKVIIGSDNPSYDLPAIDNLMYRIGKRLPLRYTTEEDYRSVDDPTEQMTLLTKAVRDKIRSLAEEAAPHTHDPVSDARHILQLWIEVEKHHGKYGDEEKETVAKLRRVMAKHPASDKCEVDSCVLCSIRDCPSGCDDHYSARGCPECDIVDLGEEPSDEGDKTMAAAAAAADPEVLTQAQE